MDKPEIGGEVFYIKLSDNWFRKGDVINAGGKDKLIVLKSYRLTWWKKVIMWFCRHYDIPFRFRNSEVKVKKYNSNEF